MRPEEFVSDLTVVGGGLAGVCAAIAAARGGRRVTASIEELSTPSGGMLSVCSRTARARSLRSRRPGRQQAALSCPRRPPDPREQAGF